MPAITVTEDNFKSEVISSERPVLLDFWASWCGPCRVVSPLMDAIAEERSDIKVCKINVDEHPALAGRYGVMSIPTLLVLKDGEVMAKSVGVKPKEQILSMLG